MLRKDTYGQSWNDIAREVGVNLETMYSFYSRQKQGGGQGRTGRSGSRPAFPQCEL